MCGLCHLEHTCEGLGTGGTGIRSPFLTPCLMPGRACGLPSAGGRRLRGAQGRGRAGTRVERSPCLRDLPGLRVQAAPTPSRGWPQGTSPGHPAGMGVATRGRPAPGSPGPRPSCSRTPQLGGRVPARQPVLQGRPRRSLEAAPACALRVLGWQTRPHVAPGLCGKLHSDRLTRRSPDRWRGRHVQIASPRCPHRRPRLLTRPPGPRRAAAGEGFNCSSSRA